MFISCNRGKRSISIDLKQDAAKEILWKLIEKADVFIENMRPGALKRLGFGKEKLSEFNPKLIYLSITGFGESGPYSSKRVYDPLIQAVSGLADLQGESIQPKMVRTVIADKTTAAYAAQAITAADKLKNPKQKYLLKTGFSGVDILMTTTLKWAIDYNQKLPSNFMEYLDHMENRPGYIAALEANQTQ